MRARQSACRVRTAAQKTLSTDATTSCEFSASRAPPEIDPPAPVLPIAAPASAVRTLTMADVEDLRSASEEEEESEDEYNYESEASTDPVDDAGDQLDVDAARCCARFGDESAERSTTKGSRALIITLKIDPTRSQASSAETRQA